MRSEVQATVEEVLRRRLPVCRIAGMDECELADILSEAIEAGLEKALELHRAEFSELAPAARWRAEA
jgi:hypothetical protein